MDLPSQKRHFKRTARSVLYRTDTPKDDTKYQVSQVENGIEIEDLRFAFQIRRTLDKTPNQCQIEIANLNSDSRALVGQKPVGVQLEAGYDGVRRLLFTGDMTYSVSKLVGPNIITTIECGDGDRVYRSARASASYGKGTPVKKILRDLAQNIGQELPPNLLNDPALDRQFSNGEVVFGPLRDELTRLIAPFGYSWTLQNGKLVVLKDAETSGEYVISEATGMIGSPEMGSPTRNGKPPNISVRCLLFPELYPGIHVRLESRFLNGSFKAVSVEHDGDTHGEAWETRLELRQL